MNLPCSPPTTRVWSLSVAAALSLASTALAQRPEVAWRPAPLHIQSLASPTYELRTRRFEVSSDSGVVIPQTYWLEGGAVVGGLTAILGAVAGVGLCHYSDSGCYNPGLKAAGGFLIGAVLGFGPGALIGGQFAKHPSASGGPPPN